MPCASLFDLARKACTKNIRAINDLGDLPYQVVRPIVLKIESPEQLRDIENVSPQIRNGDAEVWIELIKRDIPRWDCIDLTPLQNESRYETYSRLRTQSQNELENDAATLKAAMIGISKERLNHQSRQVSASTVPKLPKLGKMIFARGPKEPKATGSSTHTLAGAMGSRTKVLTGKGVMEKARKEARQQSLLRSRRSVLATPTHKLAAHATRLSVGPPSLVYAYQHPEYQHSDAPEYRERAITPAKTAVPESSRVRPSPSALKSTEEQERRLKAFTNPKPLAPASSGSDQKMHNTPPSSPPSTQSDSDSPKLRHAQDSSAMSPPTHKRPRIKSASSPEKEIRPRMRTRAPVDCFIPAKRRRLA